MKKFIIFLASIMVASVASAALMVGGYSVGSGLLNPNGETMFADTTLTGGALNRTASTGFSTAMTVIVPGAGFWDIGDAVSITGFALVIHSSSLNGTMTFDIRQGAGGDGASGIQNLASLGTATATFGGAGTTDEYYVIFDDPINFVVDANSTSIAINFSNTASLTVKADGAFPYARANYGNGNLTGDAMKISLAGTVTPVPEPATVGLTLGAGALLFVVVRRRRLKS